jgi:hypothetical protein
MASKKRQLPDWMLPVPVSTGSLQEKRMKQTTLTFVNKKNSAKDLKKFASVLDNSDKDRQEEKNNEENVFYILSPAELETVALEILAATD